MAADRTEFDFEALVEKMRPEPATRATYVRCMKTLCACVALVADDLPDQANGALAGANRHWALPEDSTEDLEALRSSCWQYLDEKHGNSTTIGDPEDFAIRALICCLYSEVNADIGDKLWFAFEMFAGHGGVDPHDLGRLIAGHP